MALVSRTLVEKILHIGARLDHQRPAQLAVERMLHEHVEHLDAVVDQDLQLLFGALRRVPAGQDRAQRACEPFSGRR